MQDRTTGRLKIAASGKNGLFGSLQTHCDIVTHLLTRLQPIIKSNGYLKTIKILLPLLKFSFSEKATKICAIVL